MTWSVYGRDVAERKREPFKCQTYSLEPIGKHHILSEKFRAVIILTQMVQVYMFCNRIIWWLCQKLILIRFCNESYISPSFRLVCVVFFSNRKLFLKTDGGMFIYRNDVLDYLIKISQCPIGYNIFCHHQFWPS